MARETRLALVIAVIWLVAAGAASHWRSWAEANPSQMPEDCALIHQPGSVDFVSCYQERMQIQLDRRGDLALHLAIPTVPTLIIALFVLGIGWVQRF